MGLLRRCGRVGAALRLLALVLGAAWGVPAALAAESEAPSAQAQAKAQAQAPAAAGSEALPSGEEVAHRINARDEGQHSAQRLVMDLIEKDGFTRTRETRLFRIQTEEGRKLVIFYERPKTLEGTAFLTHDHAEPGREDDLWLYLPALRKTRRIAAADRGRAFLATDLSYEDMKLGTRVSLEDYHWRTLGAEEVDGEQRIVVEARPVDEETAEELGYGRVELRVDPSIWLVRRSDFEDPAGRALKTARMEAVRQVDGIWTVHRIEVENHRTGHRTVFRSEDVDYEGEIPEDLFTPRALRRGAP